MISALLLSFMKFIGREFAFVTASSTYMRDPPSSSRNLRGNGSSLFQFGRMCYVSLAADLYRINCYLIYFANSQKQHLKCAHEINQINCIDCRFKLSCTDSAKNGLKNYKHFVGGSCTNGISTSFKFVSF